MNLEEVHGWITKINEQDKQANFDEAHQLEDSMLWEFVRCISDDGEHYSRIAEEMLKFLENCEGERYFS